MSGAALGVRLGTLDLPSPVLPASGTFGLGHARVFDLSRLGAIVPKTVTPGRRAGHPAPRLVEAAGGLINAIGIPSVGIDAFIEAVLPRYAGLENNTVLVANDERKLEIRDVSIVRSEPRTVYISAGIAAGEMVVTTTLDAPIPGTKLLISGEETATPVTEAAAGDAVAAAGDDP